MYCTPWRIRKRTLYCCVFLILVIGLLHHQLSSTDRQEMWDETWRLRQRGRINLRRLRHRYGRQRVYLAILRRRGCVLLLRTSLIVVLLVWSEWPRRYPLAWALSSLPVIDCLLWHLPLRWPAVSQSVVYARMVQWSHHLYRLSVLALLCEAVWPGKESTWACLAGGCVRSADGA